MGNNYVPMYFAIALIIIVGMLPLFISPFVDVHVLPQNSTFAKLGNYLLNGTDINLSIPILKDLPCVTSFFGVNFCLNTPFTNISIFIPSFVFWTDYNSRSTFVNYISSYYYIPMEVGIPLFVITVISLIYTGIKIFWGS